MPNSIIAIFTLSITLMLAARPELLKSVFKSIGEIHEREKEDLLTYGLECLFVVWTVTMVIWMLSV